MSIVVNGEIIEDNIIEEEINKIRPHYNQVFKDQTETEREKQLRDWARENVIERYLIMQAALKDKLKISQTKINESYQKFISEFGSEEDFYQKSGFKKKDKQKIKQDIGNQLQVEEHINKVCNDINPPTELESIKFYEANLAEFTSPEQVHAAHIVIHTDAQTSLEQARVKIEEIQKKLHAGKTFEEFTDKASDCPGDGSDLGYFTRGQMVQNFEDIVFSLQTNEISDIFETEFGFHIAKLYDRKAEVPIPYGEVKDQIIGKMAEEKRNTRIEIYLDELRAAADVSIAEDTPDVKTDSKIKKNDTIKMAQSKPIKLLSSVLIKPAGPDCNLDCTYCFYLEKSDLFAETKVHRMNLDVLEEMTKQILHSSESYMSFGWQGGEPTLMGLDFFRKAVEYQSKYGNGKTVGNGLQTNGLLINKEWADFLLEYKFLVGLSLDGPEHVHNHYRLDKGGKGSWEKVVKSANLLLESGVETNALIVVNDYSVKFPEEIYNFHKQLGLSFQQYIPCFETQPGKPDELAPYTVAPEEYGKFLCTLFDLWINDFREGKPTTSIRYFDSVFHNYVGILSPECTLVKECGVYVVVEHNGDVYSCDFFVDPEWKLGNIKEDTVYNFLNSDKQHEFGKIKSALPSPCQSCQWLKYCWGGCPKDRAMDTNGHNISHFCQSFMMFFEHADSRMQKLADDWRQQNNIQPQ